MTPWALGESPTSLSLNQPFVGRSGTGTAARGVPRTRGRRVVGSDCSRTSPSGSRTAIPEWVWQDQAPSQWNRQGRSIAPLGRRW